MQKKMCQNITIWRKFGKWSNVIWGKQRPAAILSQAIAACDCQDFSIMPKRKKAAKPQGGGVATVAGEAEAPAAADVEGVAPAASASAAAHTPLCLEWRLCVQGGELSEPVPLPTVTEDDQVCIQLGSYQPWLSKCLANCNRDANVVLVLADLVERIKAVFGFPGAVGDPLSAAPGRGRAALQLDDDDESPSGAAKEPSNKNNKAQKVWGFQSVTIDGYQFVLKAKNTRTKYFFMPVEGGSLANLLAYLSAAIKNPDKTGDLAQSLKRRRERAEAELEESSGDQRVKWDFAANAWEVVYRDANGCKHRTKSGFHVARVGLLGNKLLPAEYRSNRVQLETAAKKKWNLLDCSDRPRFALPEDVSP